MKDLPEKYLNRMKTLLGDEFKDFLKAYELPVCRGIRFNQRKARPETIRQLTDQWKLKPVSWCATGFYYEDGRPGLSPYHDAGVFYIQEPSAMSVVEEAKIEESDLVLDLCAAPGGKSSAAAERCGVLISNEIILNRAKILSSNIERMGFDNTIVCSADPKQLSECLNGIFDVVLADAPCSGEGMMRRDDIAVSEWSEENVQICIERQQMILENAAKMVCPGGKLVYSTCTFEIGENEEQIEHFLERHQEYKLILMKRIWPHKVNGEGHFCAVLQNEVESKRNNKTIEKEKTIQYLQKILNSNRIHILRSGVAKGESFTDKKGKKVYEPSHSEVMTGTFDQCSNGINIKDEKLAESFLHGDVLRPEENQIEIKGVDGFCGVYYDGYPLELGKRSGLIVKNHLPKGLRRV